MILFHILFHLAYGIISDTDISFSKPSAKSWAWFDFEEGGWIALNLSITSNSTGSLGIYLCGLGDVSSIAKEFKSNFCINSTNAGNYSDCDYNFTYPFYGPDYKNNTDFLNYLRKIRINRFSLTDEDWEYYLEQFIYDQTKSDRNLKGQDGSDISARIGKSKLYYFVAANCVEDKVDLSIDYTFMNPGGENLAVGYIEIKYVMNGAQVGWLSIIGLWLLSWILVRKIKLSLIQIYLILNAMVWAGFSWIFKLYWEDYSDTGKSDEELKNWSMYLFAASECFFFWITIFICAGSGITKSSIQCWAIVKAVFVIGSLFYCMRLYVEVGDDGLFSLSGSYVLILVICIWDTTKNSRNLAKQMQLISEAGIDPINTPFWIKYRMFRFLRITLIIFLLALSTCLIITIFYLEYKPWVAISTHLSIIYQCYLVFFLFFHFRKREPFFDQIETLSLGENGPLVSLDDILQGMFDRNTLFAYSEGMMLPYEKERFLPIVAEVAVIEQPGEIPSLTLGIPIRIYNSEEKDNENDEKGLPYKIEDSCISLEDVKVEISY
ncbi:unnamed protein product [Blepharisma stoltei]|uniref:Intimal thickness related receptor IRP domain-containing protein n=1 Tax=Blepharisma stoltei TaxID=1481888 RepID=A0AAU9IJR9_9CILI|nr:unnamed protein product [Blepharisma stoltei]